mmetsp:Transcript_2827/g.6298  ORF Transcript_2827/g.6298 Transcript_2827/m.6298 type:complete len:222 (+) Transcript_2827:943-1608(+)
MLHRVETVVVVLIERTNEVTNTPRKQTSNNRDHGGVVEVVVVNGTSRALLVTLSTQRCFGPPIMTMAMTTPYPFHHDRLFPRFEIHTNAPMRTALLLFSTLQKHDRMSSPRQHGIDGSFCGRQSVFSKNSYVRFRFRSVSFSAVSVPIPFFPSIHIYYYRVSPHTPVSRLLDATFPSHTPFSMYIYIHIYKMMYVLYCSIHVYHPHHKNRHRTTILFSIFI